MAFDTKKLEVIIELLTKGDSKVAVQELQKVQAAEKQADSESKKSKDSLGASVASLAGKYLAWTAVLAGGTKLVKDSLTAYDQKRAAIDRLNGTLRAGGQFTEDYSEEIQNLAGSLQSLTNVSSNAITDASRILITFGAQRNEVERLTRATLDMAAAGFDLQSSATAIGAALNGNFSPATRILKIELDENATRAEKLETVLRTLEQRFGGLAQATRGSGARDLATEFGNLEEALGELLRNGINPYVGGMTEAVKTTSQFIQLLPQTMENIRAMFAGTSPQNVLPIPNLPLNRPGATDNSRNHDPAAAKRELDDLLKLMELQKEMESLEKGFRRRPVDILQQQRGEFEGAVKGLQERGTMTASEGEAALNHYMDSYNMALTKMAQQGKEVEDALTMETLSFSERRARVINQEFSEREDRLRAYYAYEIAAAGDNASLIVTIKETEAARLAQLDKQRVRALSEFHEMAVYVGQNAAQTFSQGFAQAFVSFASGTASAGEAFKAFGAMFLQSVAQMIVQVLVLRAIMGIFAGAASSGAPGGSAPGDFSISSGVAGAAAKGGVFARGGARYMASGGMSYVNRATYLPNFNVVAGEAGKELLTVFAQPRMARIGGMFAHVGNVGANRMALVNMNDLTRAPRFMAEGGFAGTQNVENRSWNLEGGGGGKTEVVIRLEAGLRAEILEEAKSQTTVHIVNEMSRDTALSQQTKRTVGV